MGQAMRTSEDTLIGDKDYLEGAPLPLAYQHPKTFGKRKRAFFAAATFVSLLFLASYLTIQHRASDGFRVDLEPIPFKPEDGEGGSPPNVTVYPSASLSSGVRGPPTPLFRGARLSAPVIEIPDLPNIDNLLPDKQYITSWPSAGWSESHCLLPRPFVDRILPPMPRSKRRYGLCKSTPNPLPLKS